LKRELQVFRLFAGGVLPIALGSRTKPAIPRGKNRAFHQQQ